MPIPGLLSSMLVMLPLLFKVDMSGHSKGLIGDVESYKKLLSAVIGQAINDGTKLIITRRGRDGRFTYATINQLANKRDGLSFIFSKRLDDFVTYWGLDLNTGYIRKKTKDLLRKKQPLKEIDFIAIDTIGGAE